MPSISVIEAADDQITIRQAARLIGRSTTWIRDRVAIGALTKTRAANGLSVVSRRRVIALHRARLEMQAPRRVSHLRLVVDNTRP